MRLKTISANSMPEALARLKDLFGPDALIIRTDETETDVRVTVAIAPVRSSKDSPPQSRSRREGQFDGPASVQALGPLLDYHGVPLALAERIERAARSIKTDDLREGLSRGLEICRLVGPLDLSAPRPIILVGPPGAGKTLAVQKLRNTPQISDQPSRVLDSEGANPFDLAQLERLYGALRASEAEPVLVLPAGLDARESAEIGRIYSALGCRRMIATRIDASRRLGGALAAAEAGPLEIVAFGRSPDPQSSLQAATAAGLAELLWRLFPVSRRGGEDQREAS